MSKIENAVQQLKTILGGQIMVKKALWALAAAVLVVASVASSATYLLNRRAQAYDQAVRQRALDRLPDSNEASAPNLGGGGETPVPPTSIPPTSIPPTSIPPTAVPLIVAPAPTIEREPSLFDDNDCPKENTNGCTFDVGVNFNSFQHQIGIVFGARIDWQGRTFGGANGCALVILRPGFYPGLHIVSGRFEIYEVPPEDFEGWVRVLATQRADEQAAHYGCPSKTFEQIPQLSSGMPSPP